jgi:hypothetical protein
MQDWGLIRTTCPSAGYRYDDGLVTQFKQKDVHNVIIERRDGGLGIEKAL